MNEAIAIDLFVEDQAHERFLAAFVERMLREEQRAGFLRVRAARGGHSRAIAEFNNYQRIVEKDGLPAPGLVIVAIDANCSPFTRARRLVQEAVRPTFVDKTVVACPDPHIERWFLADPTSFGEVVGTRPRVRRRKCKRALYKDLLARSVVEGGHPPTLGGIEFSRELVDAMDLFRAGKAEPSLKHFTDSLRAQIRSQ